ncbi:hypothetical protein NDU88_007687 [Pleurodeles waltl]|uniref:Uncharacterized protein n=1 Tax=Pleurodeles waltl TaxID=8319 RepID=A0AAV7RVH2_PLEWA|nr:hypothetical protein NDU88_007687 [Pleurodeles waltl]
MAASRARRNAVRFSEVEDFKMEGLLFSRSVLHKELGFRPDQIDYLFAFPGGKVFEVIFTTFALFEQCLKRFKERNDSAPLKVFSINALTQPQKRWVNVSMFNEYVQSANIITWLNQFCVASHGARVRDADGVKTGYFKALVSLKRDPATEELRHIPSAIRLAKVDITVEQVTSGKGALFLVGKQAGAVDEAGNCMEPNEGASPGAPDQPIMVPTPDLDLAVHSQQTSSKATRGGVAQHHLSAVERNDIVSAGGSFLISTTGAALDAPQVQLVPPSAPQPNGTVMDDSLYVMPKVFSTLSQHSLEPASSGTANAVGTQGTVSTISSTDSCREIEDASTALEHSSFSDTAVTGEVVE